MITVGLVTRAGLALSCAVVAAEFHKAGCLSLRIPGRTGFGVPGKGHHGTQLISSLGVVFAFLASHGFAELGK